MMQDYNLIDPKALSKYVERRQGDADNCVKALNSGDFKFIAEVAHKIKGNGTTFGYPELSQLGERLEIVALKGDKEGLSQCLNEFQNWIDTTKKSI